MVVLCPAMVPQPDADEVARKFGLCVSPEGFVKEQHPKLGPINTDAEGIFVAGTCQFPKDIPDTVAQGAGAAGAVVSLGEELDLEPIKGFIEEELCSGCKICVGVCPYDAITYDSDEKISRVEEMTCKGCGLCAATCPSGAASQQNFLDEQIFAEIEGALISVED
jgi:heterodisulfide reductase subunit A